jgi:prepilin-type N-terminal cleavage/methylation domain-containing protein
MMMLLTGKQTNNPLNRHGFTLLELVLVMVLLTIVLSLVMPTLTKFFGGRMLDSEVRQFVALTHYGQSRAVSDGVPMVLWVDPRAGTYGLEQETGYNDGDSKAEYYAIDPGLTMSVSAVGSKPPAPGKRSGIHFSPDGNIITATSVGGVSFQEGKLQPVWIKPSHDGLSYEAQY